MEKYDKFIDFNEIKKNLNGFARVVAFTAEVNEHRIDLNSIKLKSFTEGQVSNGFPKGYARQFDAVCGCKVGYWNQININTQN